MRIRVGTRSVGCAVRVPAGAVCLLSLPDTNPRESHPFTVASHPGEDRLRVAIKASGDFTETVQGAIEPGQSVRVEGPYGHFTQRWSISNRQLWVAGGIGITPFLAMARDLKDSEREVTLYWTVRSRDEAWFDEELRQLAEEIPRFTYRLWLSNDTGRLTAATMPEANSAPVLDVFICGPEALRDSLTHQFRAAGVPQSQIHSEEFAFR